MVVDLECSFAIISESVQGFGRMNRFGISMKDKQTGGSVVGPPIYGNPNSAVFDSVGMSLCGHICEMEQMRCCRCSVPNNDFHWCKICKVKR